MLRCKNPFQTFPPLIQAASHGHKPQETLRDEEETKDKLLFPSFSMSIDAGAVGGQDVITADVLAGPGATAQHHGTLIAAPSQ